MVPILLIVLFSQILTKALSDIGSPYKVECPNYSLIREAKVCVLNNAENLKTSF